MEGNQPLFPLFAPVHIRNITTMKTTRAQNLFSAPCYNITDALAGKTASPRHEFFYFNDESSLVALRYNQ